MKTRTLTMFSMFVVLEVVVSRFFSIKTPLVRLSFTYIPMAIAGYLYGWKFGGFSALIADLIGATLFPSGPFFPGFSVSAFITGAMYGILKDKETIFPTLFGIALFNTFVVNLGLNTLWLYMMGGQSLMHLIPIRAGKALLVLPLKIVLISGALSWIKKNKEIFIKHS